MTQEVARVLWGWVQQFFWATKAPVCRAGLGVVPADRELARTPGSRWSLTHGWGTGQQPFRGELQEGPASP